MVIGTSWTSTRRRQTRQENVATLAIQVPRWLGVTAAIRILFEHLYPFPGFRTDAPHVKLLPSSAEPVDPHVGRTLRGVRRDESAARQLREARGSLDARASSRAVTVHLPT